MNNKIDKSASKDYPYNYSMSPEVMKRKLRERREKECFQIVNRGRLWYNKLSTSQLIELTNWYNAWLDVTETFKVPSEPSWINEKLSDEVYY